jgi:hypothetical protein
MVMCGPPPLVVARAQGKGVSLHHICAFHDDDKGTILKQESNEWWAFSGYISNARISGTSANQALCGARCRHGPHPGSRHKVKGKKLSIQCLPYWHILTASPFLVAGCHHVGRFNSI